MRNRTNRYSQTLRIALYAMLILISHRLTVALLDASWVWKLNDIGRAAFVCALSFSFLHYISYRDLKLKCVVAAFFGYSLADLIVCIIWYTLDFRGYFLVLSIQSVLMIFTFMLYWFRSYKQKSDAIEDESIYCLRRVPSCRQDFLIALAGSFGSYGGYAIAHKNKVYIFKGGYLRSFNLDGFDLGKYHVTKGRRRDDVSLDGFVGTKWKLLGNNCITILGRFWGRYGR